MIKLTYIILKNSKVDIGVLIWHGMTHVYDLLILLTMPYLSRQLLDLCYCFICFLHY